MRSRRAASRSTASASRTRRRDRAGAPAGRGVRAPPRQEDPRRCLRRRAEPASARMPFTPSHAVVALPFVRTPLVPAAIAIGAMTPDLPLFVRGAAARPTRCTHTFGNVDRRDGAGRARPARASGGSCCVRPFGELSPRWLARAACRRSGMPGARRGCASVRASARRGGAYPLLLAVSLLIGVAEPHRLGPLHPRGALGGRARSRCSTSSGVRSPGYKWLQHGSSVIGLVILGGLGAGCGCATPDAAASASSRAAHGRARGWWLVAAGRSSSARRCVGYPATGRSPRSSPSRISHIGCCRRRARCGERSRSRCASPCRLDCASRDRGGTAQRPRAGPDGVLQDPAEVRVRHARDVG